MNSIKILDVTLRDGGCVNDFNFGIGYMKAILHAQEEAGIDIIELGYIDENNGSKIGRTKFVDDKAITESFLLDKKNGLQYVAMIDYGKFDIDSLQTKSNKSIDGIRLAFHKRDLHEAVSVGQKILDKGYDLYIQPMITFQYSDYELLDLIDNVNDKLSNASAFYIVDSFGEMRPNDMSRILNLVEHNLLQSMPIGFHSHNNLQLSYSNAMSLLTFPSSRDKIIDCSIMGMGKGAGNLNSELLLEHLNLFYGKNYNISPLLDVIDKVINQLHSEFYWGYSPEYYLSSNYHCTPSYASHFYNKHMLPIDQVGELLSMISKEKRSSFDKNYAEELYRLYNEKKTVDDTNVINTLKNEFFDKRILLIAPGKSIINSKEQITDLAHCEDVISIGLNITLDFDLDYIFTTRDYVYTKAVSEGKSVIVPSNVSKGGRGNVKVINYSNWIEYDVSTHDSSTVMILKVLQECAVKEVLLAGFDGFSVNINDNYSDPDLRRPVSAEQAEMRNEYFKNLFNRMKIHGLKLVFITPSMYE